MTDHKDHPLVRAARYNDAMSEELGLEGYVDHLGLDLERAMHVATQRAIRMVVLQSRGQKTLNLMAKTGSLYPPLSPAEQAQVPLMAALVLDGIAIGHRAATVEEQA